MERTAAQSQLLKLRLRKKERELSEKGIAETGDVSHMLVQVQDALRRIQFNAYGVCIACGKQIPWLRLDAIPWTPYCEEDQSKYEPTVDLKATAIGQG